MPQVYYVSGGSTSPNASGFTLTTTKFNDVGVADQTTYESGNAAGGSVSYVYGMWDLDTASTVTQMRATVGYYGAQIIAFDASNNGTTWVNALTNSAAGGITLGSLAWQNYNTSSITSTQYRYWRIRVVDDQSDSLTNFSARLSDFRLYNGASEYTIAAVSSGKTIIGLGSAVGLGSITF